MQQRGLRIIRRPPVFCEISLLMELNRIPGVSSNDSKSFARSFQRRIREIHALMLFMSIGVSTVSNVAMSVSPK